MKKGSCFLLALFVSPTLTAPTSIAGAHPVFLPFNPSNVVINQNGNSISGHVFGDSRRPVPDVYVELLNDVYSTIARTKTTGAGLYIFRNLSQGNFKVRVLPYGTDYSEQTQDLVIQNISIVGRMGGGGGAENAQMDFYLRLKPNANAGPFAGLPGVVFAQEVPEPARKLYELGIGNLREKKEKDGFENLKKSLEIFPTYYLALDRLGTEYVARGHYEAGYVLLTKSVEVNRSSFSSVFGLGVAQCNLKQNNEAIENLKRATVLYNKSINAQLWLGIALKRGGKPDQAELAFKRADELSKSKSAEVHWQIALLYSEQKRYKEAADKLELFLKHQSDARDAGKIKQLIQQLREKAAKE